MGLASWLRGKGWRAPAPAVVSSSEAPHVHMAAPALVAHGFAVLDLETTGLVAARDRIVELAVVRLDPSGRVQDEWDTLVNPGRSVGASQQHGITSVDVRGAPRFGEILEALTERLAGRVLVAHNARFDMAFIRNEYARAGSAFPDVPYLCTLEASWTYLPDLARRRLADCCWVCGIPLHHAHSALGDARATAQLLSTYLDPAVGTPPRPEHLALPTLAMNVAWPKATRASTRTKPRRQDAVAEVPASPGTLWALLDDLPLSTIVEEGAPETSGPYLELLFEVLEDGVLTDDEAGVLVDVAKEFALTREQVQATHRAFLLALAHRIVEDGKVTRDERELLAGASKSLGFHDRLPRMILDEARSAFTASRTRECQPLPEHWAHGEPLRISQSVAFTGCDQLVRAGLEGRAQAAGLRVTGSVSRKTAVLVTDGTNPTTTKATSARRHKTRVVTPEVFATLVQYVQAATETTVIEQAGPADGVTAAQSQAPVHVDDRATIRAWARENGYQVGRRGRVPAEVIAAHRVANGKHAAHRIG